MSSASPPKRQKRSIVSSHFHCYLLHSMDPKHPMKTYIGFTTDPHRRIRQHNGLLKAGGARRTRISGRPWQFACIVHGFTSHRSGLQFEWAWQHSHKSIAIRNAVGDVQAKKLQSKRGLVGKLGILKTIVTECEELYHDAPNLTIYFLNDKTRTSFERIPCDSEVPMPERVNHLQVGSLEEMPFWNDRKQSKEKTLLVVADEFGDNVQQQQLSMTNDCMLCSRPVLFDEPAVTCTKCKRQIHDICNDIHKEDGDGLCPRCDTPLDCDSSFDDDDDGDDEDDEEFSSEEDMECLTVPMTKRLFGMHIQESDAERSIDSLDALFAPSTVTRLTVGEEQWSSKLFQNTDGVNEDNNTRRGPEFLHCSDSDNSFIMNITQSSVQSEVLNGIGTSAYDSLGDLSPFKMKLDEVQPELDIIDLCSP